MATILPWPTGARSGPATTRLGIDPTACHGVGMCAHLAPDLIDVDSWGYPVLPVAPVTGRDLRAARAAVNGCPRRALFLQE